MSIDAMNIFTLQTVHWKEIKKGEAAQPYNGWWVVKLQYEEP